MPNSKFDKLVAEAVEVARELRAFDTRAGWKLTAPAFVQAAMDQANTNKARLAMLKATLDKPHIVEARGALRRMIEHIRGLNVSTPHRHLLHLTTDTAESEIVPYTRLELFALAARLAAKEYPDDFGTCEGLEARQREFRALEARRDELFRRVESEWGAGDVLMADPPPPERDRGLRIITFKVSGGKVPVGSKAGERLVNHLLSRPSTAAAA